MSRDASQPDVGFLPLRANRAPTDKETLTDGRSVYDDSEVPNVW